MAIQTCIVEADKDLRQSLAALLNATSGIRCVGSYDSAKSALVGLQQTGSPDVAVVDVHLPGVGGAQCVAQLKSRLPKLEVLMVAAHHDQESILDSLRAGASGCILKNRPHAELVKAIEQIHAGGAPMSHEVARKLVDSFFQPKRHATLIQTLTEREKEILGLLAHAYLYKEIAARLGVSVNTVKTHLCVIYEKLGVQSRTEATLKYLGH
jgi:DNA-binding NarL/FixJ family response regulator